MSYSGDISYSGGSASRNTSSRSGRCNYPSDRAANGSRCGGRAASVRPGGR
ncbi:MAG: transmembrane anchored protein [Cyanobacteria bacterium REEB494]|nr:transmembrane anchored protein [Cyanobacteria bacterium REEB494]